MRSETYTPAQTTRLSNAFLDEPLPARTKTLAAIVASFASIPGWVIRKPHIRAVAAADGFDAAWAALLHTGILTCVRTRTPQGRYEYAYRLDRARVCGGDAFTLIPNELLHAALPMNARWLYIVCAQWMSLPSFVFDRERLRRRAGFGHDRFQHAYTALRRAGWLNVARVPGCKRRRYTLSRCVDDAFVPMLVAEPNRPQTPVVIKQPVPTRRASSDTRTAVESYYQTLLFNAPCTSSTVQNAIRVLTDTRCTPRPSYRIDAQQIPGTQVRAVLESLTASQLLEILQRVDQIPQIQNFPIYLLTACCRAASAPAHKKTPCDTTASYDLEAFDRMTLYGPFGKPPDCRL